MNLGRLIVVGNKTTGMTRTTRSRAARYHQLTYVNPTGSIEQALLTDRELAAATDRAQKNAKTLAKITWLDRFASFKIRLVTKLLSLIKR